jgi:hypothetical protein
MSSTPATSLTLVSSGLAESRLQPPFGRPEISQFITVVRKTTRWAAQHRRINFDGQPTFGTKVSLTIPRLAELVGDLTLVVTLPDLLTPQLAAIQAAGGTSLTDLSGFLGPLFGWTNCIGHAMINMIELEIGGAIVDRMDGRLLEVLDELYEPLEALPAKNQMIQRNPTNYSPLTSVGPAGGLTVYVPLPFWFCSGSLAQYLPLDAISAESVVVHVTFNPLNTLTYTDARIDSDTESIYNPVTPPGAMLMAVGSSFWRSNPASSQRVYGLNRTIPSTGISGELIPGITMPNLVLGDTYILAEYISVEEPEAIALRSSELTYFVEQHNAVPVLASQRATEMHIPLELRNPTKEILWVLQRPEAADYNAWFLFTRDLSGVGLPAPWWPDAQLTLTQANDWMVLPAFRNSGSEPLAGATLLYNGEERFDQTGGSFFRTLIPTLHYKKTAVQDRYIYAWSFGLRPSLQGEEDSSVGESYAPRGTANWDKIPRKELYLRLTPAKGGGTPPSVNAYVWTTTWNVMKVFGGRAGMLFDY